MVKRCCYGTCKSDTRYPEKSGYVKFLPFPKPKTNLSKTLAWIKACGRPHSQLNVQTISRHTYVCTKHFHSESGPSDEFPNPIPVDGTSVKSARPCNRQSRLQDMPTNSECQQTSVMPENEKMDQTKETARGMGKRCCYGVCNSDSRYPGRDVGIVFFPFPKPKTNPAMCLRWLEACGRPYHQLHVNNITRNTYVCSKHFRDSTGPTIDFPDPKPAWTRRTVPGAGSRSTKKNRKQIVEPDFAALEADKKALELKIASKSGSARKRESRFASLPHPDELTHQVFSIKQALTTSPARQIFYRGDAECWDAKPPRTLETLDSRENRDVSVASALQTRGLDFGIKVEEGCKSAVYAHGGRTDVIRENDRRCRDDIDVPLPYLASDGSYKVELADHGDTGGSMMCGDVGAVREIKIEIDDCKVEYHEDFDTDTADMSDSIGNGAPVHTVSGVGFVGNSGAGGLGDEGQTVGRCGDGRTVDDSRETAEAGRSLLGVAPRHERGRQIREDCDEWFGSRGYLVRPRDEETGGDVPVVDTTRGERPDCVGTGDMSGIRSQGTNTSVGNDSTSDGRCSALVKIGNSPDEKGSSLSSENRVEVMPVVIPNFGLIYVKKNVPVEKSAVVPDLRGVAATGVRLIIPAGWRIGDCPREPFTVPMSSAKNAPSSRVVDVNSTPFIRLQATMTQLGPPVTDAGVVDTAPMSSAKNASSSRVTDVNSTPITQLSTLISQLESPVTDTGVVHTGNSSSQCSKPLDPPRSDNIDLNKFMTSYVWIQPSGAPDQNGTADRIAASPNNEKNLADSSRSANDENSGYRPYHMFRNVRRRRDDPRDRLIHTVHYPDMKPNYQCKICGHTSMAIDNLRIHLLVHTVGRPFKCPDCSRDFKYPSILHEHRKIHSDTRSFVCKLCGRTYGAPKPLRIHMRKHTGEKPYLCAYCGVLFAHATSFKAHVRIHTGEKPYKCPRCPYTATQLSSLGRHKLTKHGTRSGGIPQLDCEQTSGVDPDADDVS